MKYFLNKIALLNCGTSHRAIFLQHKTDTSPPRLILKCCHRTYLHLVKAINYSQLHTMFFENLQN